MMKAALFSAGALRRYWIGLGSRLRTFGRLFYF